MRTAVGRLLVIDDLRRGHLCDLVLDPNLGRKAADYPGVESLTGRLRRGGGSSPSGARRRWRGGRAGLNGCSSAWG